MLMWEMYDSIVNRNFDLSKRGNQSFHLNERMKELDFDFWWKINLDL